MARNRPTSLRKRLYNRDKGICGVHIGGCGQRIASYKDCTADHLVPQAVIPFALAESRQTLKSDMCNQQVMHNQCNQQRWGTLQGAMPQFKCDCHSIQVGNDGYMCLVTTLRPRAIKHHPPVHCSYYAVPLIRRTPQAGATMIVSRGSTPEGFGGVGYFPQRFGHMVYVPDASEARLYNIVEWLRTGWIAHITWVEHVVHMRVYEDFHQTVWSQRRHALDRASVKTFPTGKLTAINITSGITREFMGWLNSGQTLYDVRAEHAKLLRRDVDAGQTGIIWFD